MSQKLFFRTLALVAAATFASCSTNGYVSLGNWEKEALLVSGSTETPEHTLPKTEYPFDDQGNYVAAWAASGEGRFGKAHSTWASIITIDTQTATPAAFLCVKSAE
jgi:hypothetical protein